MMDTYPGSEGSDGSGPNYADMYAGASSTELREAAQAWADEKSVMFDSDVRLVEAANAALAAFDSLAAQLEASEWRERVLRDSLGAAPHPNLVNHPVYTVWYESSRDALTRGGYRCLTP